MKQVYILLSICLICTINSLQAQTVSTLAGSTSSGSANGTGAAASFDDPFGVAVDGAGNIYVADMQNNEIRKIVISSGAVTTIAGYKAGGSNNGIGTAAGFDLTYGVAYDGKGNLFIADASNNMIRQMVLSSGVVSTLAGSGSTGSADGTGIAASFSAPCAVATDGINVYVADRNNNEIRQVVIATGVVTTLAGSTAAGSTNGTGGAARFNYPFGVAVDAYGNLYVGDYYNNEIRKIVISTGVVTTFAGSTTSGSADGVGASASFSNPVGVCVYNHDMFVADYTNNKIRHIDLYNATVSTVAGTGAQGTTNGAGSSATFTYPTGVICDGTNLYVADEYNYEIREITGIPLGVNEVKDNNSISVYPNPTNEMLNIQLAKPMQCNATLKIMDMTGREIAMQSITAMQSSLEVNVGYLPVGVYFISLQNADGSVLMDKFVKQ